MKKILRVFAYILSTLLLLFSCLYVSGILLFASQDSWNFQEVDPVIYLSIPFSISTGLALLPQINKRIRLALITCSSVVIAMHLVFSLCEFQKAKNLPDVILNADSVRFKNYEARVDREINEKERETFSKLLREIKPRINICKTTFKFFTGTSVCGCRGNGSITLMKDNKKDAYYFRHNELLIGSFSFVQVDETKVIEAMKYLIRGEN